MYKKKVLVRTLCCTFISYLLLSCNQQDISYGLKEKFKVNKHNLDSLITSFHTKPLIDTIFTNDINKKAKDFPPSMSNLIDSLGILDISRQIGGPRRGENKIYILKTTWLPGDSIFIVYNPRDTLETKEGYYRKDQNSNEIWGLGQDWEMIKIVKYLQKDI